MMISNLHKEWLQLGEKYCKDSLSLDSIWMKIKKKYTEKKRYYHNLNHINWMLQLAEENKNQIVDMDVLLFSIWFHDIIYKSSKKDNEEKSADFARSTLQKFSIKEVRVDKVCELILSTKAHQVQLKEDGDNAFLLDFDLSILGQGWEVYHNYIHKIRKEYSIYPDFLYKPGRKKVLLSFLNRETLYFTGKYRVLYEDKARENLEREINLLT